MEKDTQAFDNVKDQIGWCGIWCGSCIVGNGTLRILTRKYEETTNAYSLREWAPTDFDYAEFANGLKSIQGIHACAGCLKGGGRDDCEMRACASAREIAGCSICAEFGDCEHKGILETMRSGALAAGLYVADTGTTGKEQIEDWSDRLERRWPSNILFTDGT
jgi:hypothetical protein